MAGTVANLFSGGATKVGIGYKAVTADLGFTKDGIRIARETDWLDFEVDQLRSTVKKQVVKGDMRLTTTLAEGSLLNIQYAWSMPTSALISNSSYLQLIESDGNAAEELSLYIEGPTVSRTGSTKRVYQLYRCVAMAQSEYNIARGVESNVPVEFHIMYDNTKTGTGVVNGKFGEFYDNPEAALT